MSLTLKVRTPSGVTFEGPVSAIRAEDASGWFGLRTGREEVIAILPPGLLVFRDADGEGFIALSGGLLSLEGGVCQVTSRDATLSRNLDDVAEQLERAQQKRLERTEELRDALEKLAREALRRMMRRERP